MTRMSESLRCPVTGSKLELVKNEDGTEELIAEPGATPRLAFPIRHGVPVLLEHYAREIKA